jgi:hypothetical protein
MISAPSSNGRSPATAWRTATVHAFFAQVPWEGAPHVDFAPSDASTPAVTPMLQQTVGDFFQRFQWDGTPAIAAPVVPLSIQSPAPEVSEALTLDDFSGLF